ncbi:MAG TPA: phosphatase PAP2 family protein [Bryobacteraceae bacterium]|jgi:undecaprenyl-diphosphatase|nr:phosphatase PAP2 family protein [Bryobacteraceae bacterium]
MAVSHYLLHADERLMRHVLRWQAPRWLRIWMLASTRGGDGWLWYGLALILAIFGGDDRYAAIGAEALATGMGIAVLLTLKPAIGRTRPCGLEPHCWATLLPPDRFSFPSGHTITAFATAVSISMFYPAVLPVLLFCAVSIAASRIILGMHYLSDVLAGAAIGTLLGYGSVALMTAIS